MIGKMDRFKLGAAVALAGISFATVAAEGDYSQLKKDVGVMEKILLTEFDSRNDGGRVHIRGSYLAEQGAVFTVNAPHMMSFFSFDSDDEASTFTIRGSRGGIPSMDRDLELSFAGDVRTIVQNALGSSSYPAFDSELREVMRELVRDSREIEREMSRLRVEMIHVGDDKKREIEADLADLEKEMAELEKKRENMNSELEAEVQAFEEKREKAREQREQARRERLAAIEDKLLRSLCDYGSTLQNLPNDEHVSLVIEEASDRQQKVYVFDRGDVTNCKSGSNTLRDSALHYMF